MTNRPQPQLSLPKNKIRVLLLEGVHPSAIEALAEQGYHEVRTLKGALEGDALKEALAGVHLLGIRSRTKMTREVIEAADRLIAIGCFCIGTNQVDLEAARGAGVPVFNAPYANTRSVAELTMGEAMLLLRRVPSRSAGAHQGRWDKSAAHSHEVRGKTLGIVGYGSIGSQVSILAEAMGMNVLYYDIAPKLPHGNAQATRSLEELLRESDIVTLHVPELPTTRNMISEREIRLMKPGAILINNARGSIVDVEAEARALAEGHLLGAAADVFPVEPKNASTPFESPLQGCDNVILTPHIGASTLEAQERIGQEVARKLATYSDIGATLGAVNFPEVQLPARPEGMRFMHVHQNRPGILRQVNDVMAETGCNVTAQYLQTDGGIGYVVVEATLGAGTGEGDVLARLGQLEGTIRTRLIRAAG
ncbi:phosphoglycerate dehydrogenase [Formicincola oecophyllae]|uniref:D-3-phosphoglycerate dehydrogenase n=1 Tax=Formicincola oecophyllae TaxID=2558361 RepID=A0A4Y6U916_9PROT|nr:phosphoglycerate dehydrogenase [Formicincola oecophyllae]QDH13963.1 phosphoglycerate dehydrogenase [Formicincola oecophyllae]